MKANKAEALQSIGETSNQNSERGETQNFLSPKAGSNKICLDNSQSSEKSVLGFIKQDTASSKADKTNEQVML